jgi:hypothetical protein
MFYTNDLDKYSPVCVEAGCACPTLSAREATLTQCDLSARGIVSNERCSRDLLVALRRSRAIESYAIHWKAA